VALPSADAIALEARPRGVAIVFGVQVALALVALLIGAILVYIPTSMPTAELANELQSQAGGSSLSAYKPAELATAVEVLGSLVAALGFIALVAAFGVVRGKGWGRRLELVLATIGFLLSFLGAVSAAAVEPAAALVYVIGLVGSTVLLWYFTRPGVRAFYGQPPS
jgi:hypothetical protein